MDKNQKVEGVKMFKLFLDKSDQRKMELFRYLENKPLLSENREKILDELCISEFLLNKTIEELSIDFSAYGLADDFQLFIEGNNVVLIESGRGTSLLLEDYLIRNSLGFSMLTEIFFETFDSVNEYAIKNYVSHPLVYRKLNDLRKVLAKMEININKKFLLTGSEEAIRGLITFCFTKYYGRTVIFYPSKIQTNTTQFLDEMRAHMVTDFPHFKESKLIHFLSISLFRIQQQATIRPQKKSIKINFELNNSYQIIYHWLERCGAIKNAKTIKCEAQRIFLFLFSEEALVTFQPNLVEMLPEIRDLNKLFSETLQETFPFSEKYLLQIENKITIFHLKILYFQIENANDIQGMDITYYYEVYPEYFEFCKSYIELNKKKTVIWLTKEYLFFNYLLVLIEFLPLKELLKPLYICIDFSFGKNYNQLIKKNIQKIADLNIVYQNHIDEKTDLILTDKEFVTVSKRKQIIWLVPPRAIDWANFTNQLIQVRKEKL